MCNYIVEYVYSGTSLIQTPLGHEKVSWLAIVRCSAFELYKHLVQQKVSCSLRYPYLGCP